MFGGLNVRSAIRILSLLPWLKVVSRMHVHQEKGKNDREEAKHRGQNETKLMESDDRRVLAEAIATQ